MSGNWTYAVMSGFAAGVVFVLLVLTTIALARLLFGLV